MQNSERAAGVQLADAQSNASIGAVTDFSSGGLSAHRVNVETRNGYTFNLHSSAYSLGLNDLQMSDGETFADNLLVRGGEWRGRMTFIPPDCPTWGWHAPTSQPQSFTVLYIDPIEIERDLALRLKHLEQPQLHLFDTDLRCTLRKIDGCLSSGVVDSLYFESLLVVAALELSRTSRLSNANFSRKSPLNAALLARLKDFIHANLSGSISLTELSTIAGLSRFHFLRSFKCAVGETPYQYLLRCRVERARHLLCAGQLRVGDVALAVGFKNSTRLGAAFRKLLNRTPREFRRAIGENQSVQ